MGKNIDKKDFQKGLALASGQTSLNEQHSLQSRVSGWLNDINFDLESDTDFIGCFIEDCEWQNPDESDVLEWLECQTENPEFRMEKYEFDGKLSIAERKAFKESYIENAVSNGDYPGVYVGTLQHENEKLLVYSTRRGHSFEGIEVEVLGLFSNKEEAEAALFKDGELH